MYTDCPTCRQQFRVRARHLSAAAGEVRCGYCGHRFNALPRLRDEPLPAAVHAPVVAVPAAAEPHFELPAEETPREAERPVVDDGTAAAVEVLELLEEETPRRGYSRVVWGVLAALLLVAGLLQVAWFQRDYLLQRFPALLPVVERICARFQCTVLRHRDLSAIRVVSRDVRLHPRFENALLVNATISNRSPLAQPYPVLQLLLYDTAGHVTAYRNFAPSEYLDSSLPLPAGMASDALLHIVLEVAATTNVAQSFELGFL